MQQRFLSLVCLAGVICASSSQAASFDCAKTTSAREHLICGSTLLSQLDQQLGSLYVARLASLSPAGAASLRNAERAWLHATNLLCDLGSQAPPYVNGEPPETCLVGAYKSRIPEIEQAGRFGSYVFTRVDTYRVHAHVGEMFVVADGKGPWFDIQHAGYPQIDGAKDPIMVAWNKQAATAGIANADIKIHGLVPDTSEGDYQIGMATRRLISLRWIAMSYDYGDPHPAWGGKTWNAVPGSPCHELTPIDLFGKNDTWKQRFEDIALSALKGKGWTGNDFEEEGVRRVVDNPQSWFLRREGLEVSFVPGSVGSYMSTPANQLILWSRLEPFLDKNFRR